MEFPQKIKNGTALWPSYSISGNVTEETRSTDSKKYTFMYNYVHWGIMYNSQDLESSQVPISRWIDKKSHSTFTQWNTTQAL